MATIRVAIDRIQSPTADQKTLDTFAQKLREAGHTVTTHGRGPNKIQEVMTHKENACDLMIQVAGGRCLGTLCDFHLNLNTGYYKAKAGGFAYFKKWDDNWKSYRSGDDGFSTRPGTAIYKEVERQKGKTLPAIFKEYTNMYYGHGDTAEECAKTFLENYGGNSTSEAGATGGGKSLLDIIKNVCSDHDPLGPEVTLTGDTVNIRRSSPQYATPITTHNIVKDSISFTEYDNDTPNVYGKVKDTQLVNKYGKIPLEEVNDSWQTQVLLMSQRGHSHSIDLKVIADPRLVAGQWVKLYLPDYGINGRLYYITKWTHSEERTFGLTLEPGPPSLYVEEEQVVDETNTEEEETTEET